jgi:hypothetical protein
MRIKYILIVVLLIINWFFLNGCSTTSDISKIKIGAIAGIVNTTEKINDGSKSNILLLNTELGCATGKDGKYLLMDVPIGIYKVRASSLRYHPSEYYNVRVAEDSVTILRFDLIPDILAINPPILIWEEENKEMYGLNNFILGGKLFDLE